LSQNAPAARMILNLMTNNGRPVVRRMSVHRLAPVRTVWVR
jgi:hypothetical protein